jgi:hypothetical protein
MKPTAMDTRRQPRQRAGRRHHDDGYGRRGEVAAMPMTAMITVGMVGAHVMVPSPTPPDRAEWPLVPPA